MLPRSNKSSAPNDGAKIYSRTEHTLSRSQISDNALRVLYRLKKMGYEAYLVGGCVRDLLLGYEPKDFDVVTDAKPEEVRKVFNNCRLIGRRFRLAHVYFGRSIIEVATFRGSSTGDQGRQRVHKDGRLLRDNIFGNIEDDAWRRDFTVNALYYNIRDFTVRDYTGGMADHATGTLRLIGDPLLRYQEDPVRMLRAVRFAAKLGFKLEPTCEQALFTSSQLLTKIPAARLYDEVLKLFLSGNAAKAFTMLRHYGLFSALFPPTEKCLTQEKNNACGLFIERALANSDRRISEAKSITPYFFLAVFLWHPMQQEVKQNRDSEDSESDAYQQAANTVIAQQVKSLTLPKHITWAMREVWLLQLQLNRRSGNKPFNLMALPKFRAAYDFLLLRAEIGEVDAELAQWWTAFQTASASKQQEMTRLPNTNQKRKKEHASNHKTHAMSEVYIGLGSNLKQPKQQLKLARLALAEHPSITELDFSSLYSSPPLGAQDQPDYINAVMKIKTALPAIDLLRVLQAIETKQGRVRQAQRWSARTLDLDLLLYAEQRIENPDLQVPHKGLAERAFVLYPLQEIAPKDLAIPDQGSLEQVVARCDLNGLEKLA